MKESKIFSNIFPVQFCAHTLYNLLDITCCAVNSL